VLFLHGGVAHAKQRDRDGGALPERADGPRVFVLSLKAGGTGLNLTRPTTCSTSTAGGTRRWRTRPRTGPSASARPERAGAQVRVVGTLEERIDEMIESKKSIVNEVIGTGEGWITELSNEELKNVFALSAEALDE
jgi:hypothetical protein